MSFEEIVTKGGTIFLAALTLVQIAPIKINPWSFLAQLLGRAINGELIDKVGSLEKEFVKLRTMDEEKDAIDLRNHILLFGDEVARGVKHSEEHFNQILQDMTDYEAYCRSHEDFRNNKTVITSARIKEVYKNCLKTGDFL